MEGARVESVKIDHYLVSTRPGPTQRGYSGTFMGSTLAVVFIALPTLECNAIAVNSLRREGVSTAGRREDLDQVPVGVFDKGKTLHTPCIG